MAKKETQGPQFVRFFGPVIESLKQLGGSGQPAEVRGKIIELQNISEAEQSETIGSGQSRFDNQVAWARFYLVKAGFLDSSTRGVWSLTERGRNSTLTHKQAVDLFKEVHQQFTNEKEVSSPTPIKLPVATTPSEEVII